MPRHPQTASPLTRAGSYQLLTPRASELLHPPPARPAAPYSTFRPVLPSPTTAAARPRIASQPFPHRASTGNWFRQLLRAGGVRVSAQDFKSFHPSRGPVSKKGGQILPDRIVFHLAVKHPSGPAKRDDEPILQPSVVEIRPSATPRSRIHLVTIFSRHVNPSKTASESGVASASPHSTDSTRF